MPSTLKTKNHVKTGHCALTGSQVVTQLAKLEGWKLTGDGPAVAIEKTFEFSDFHQTMSFVNAIAFIANRQNHHPDLSIQFGRCHVRFNTHDVGGISAADFKCAAALDALLA